MNNYCSLGSICLLLICLLATSNSFAAPRAVRESSADDAPLPPPEPAPAPAKNTARKAATPSASVPADAGEPVDSHIELDEESADSSMQPGNTAPQTEDAAESPDPDARDVKAAQLELRARRGALRGCYDKALKNDASLRGSLTIRLAVALSGAFTEVSFPEDSLRSSIVTTCIRDQVLQWKMAPLKGSVRLSLDLPLTFKP